MKNETKQKWLIIFLVVTLILLLTALLKVFMNEWSRIEPKNVRFTNLTSNSITISWTTEKPTIGSVVVYDKKSKFPISFHLSDNGQYFDSKDKQFSKSLISAIINFQLISDPKVFLGKEDLDVDGIAPFLQPYHTHHVVVNGLNPGEDYTFMVGDNILFRGISDINGNFNISTLNSSGELLSPYPAYGSLKENRNDNNFPINDAIVYFNYYNKINGARSEVYSSSVNQTGNWYIDISGVIDSNGKIFKESHNLDSEDILVELVIDAGPLGLWKKFEQPKSLSPALPIILGYHSSKIGYNDVVPIESMQEEVKGVLLAQAGVGEEVCELNGLGTWTGGACKCVGYASFNTSTGVCSCMNGYTQSGSACIKTSSDTACSCACISPYSDKPPSSGTYVTTLASCNPSNCDSVTCYKSTEPECTGCSCSAPCPPSGYSEYNLTDCSDVEINCSDYQYSTCQRVDSCGKSCSYDNSTEFSRKCYRPLSELERKIINCDVSGGYWDTKTNECSCPDGYLNNQEGKCEVTDSCQVSSTACECECPSTHPYYICDNGSCNSTTVGCPQVDNCGNECEDNQLSITCFSPIQENPDPQECYRIFNNTCEKFTYTGNLPDCGSNYLTLQDCQEDVSAGEKTYQYFYIKDNECIGNVSTGVNPYDNPNVFQTHEECLKALDKKVCWENTAEGNRITRTQKDLEGRAYIEECVDGKWVFLMWEEEVYCEVGASCDVLNEVCSDKSGNELVCTLECLNVGCGYVFISPQDGVDFFSDIPVVKALFTKNILPGDFCEINELIGGYCYCPTSENVDDGDYCPEVPTCCDYIYGAGVSEGAIDEFKLAYDIVEAMVGLGMTVGVPDPTDLATLILGFSTPEADIKKQFNESVFEQLDDWLKKEFDISLRDIYGFNPFGDSDSAEGKICHQDGRVCESGQCLPSSKVQGAKESWIIDKKNYSDNIVSYVYGQEQTTQYLIDINSQILSELKPGVYSFEYEGNYYTFSFNNSSKELIVYLDVNGNSKYDEEDIQITDIASEIKVKVVSQRFDYKLKKGLNFVAFPFIIENSESRTASGLLKVLNEVYSNSIYSISRFSDGQWRTVGQNVEVYDNDNYLLLPGVGYVIKAKADVDIGIIGKPIKFEDQGDNSPIYFLSGWNLIGLYGTNLKSYTARSLLEDINTSHFVADNVTRWDREIQKYDGVQITDGEEYGFDFPLTKAESYFVRIRQGMGNWQPNLQ